MGKLKFIKNKKILSSFLLCLTAVISAILIISTPVTAIIGASNTNGAIYKGNEKGNKIALTFNVYENAKNVEKILDILSIEKQKATFFIGGCWADDNLETVAKIVSAGHEIGSHGYYHKDHAKLSLEENKREIEYNHKLIFSAVGVKMNLFAPPSGSFSKNTVKACENLGYRVIMWTTDTIDWRDHDEDLIVKRALKNISAGNIILMHPTDCTVTALSKIIKGIKNNSLTTDTVSNVIDGEIK
jgi:peptidoglycan/xylan/chitin deacetylase (PgdA/CDA1 family)